MAYSDIFDDEAPAMTSAEEVDHSQVQDPRSMTDDHHITIKNEPVSPSNAPMPSFEQFPGPSQAYDFQQNNLYFGAIYGQQATFGGPYPGSFTNGSGPVPAPQTYQDTGNNELLGSRFPAPSVTGMAPYNRNSLQVPEDIRPYRKPAGVLAGSRQVYDPTTKKSSRVPAGGRNTKQNTQLPTPVQTPGDRRYTQRVEKTRASTQAPVAAKAQTRRKANPRELMRWNLGIDQMLALTFEYELQKQGLEFDWEALGKHFEKKPSGEAVKQHLVKVRTWRAQNDQPNPPKFVKKGRRGNNTSRPTAPPPSSQRGPKIKREFDDDKEDYEDARSIGQEQVSKEVTMGDGYRVEDLDKFVYERGPAGAEEKKTKAKKPAGAEQQRSRQGQKTVPGFAELQRDSPHRIVHQGIGYQELPLGQDVMHSGGVLPDLGNLWSPLTSDEGFDSSQFPQYDPAAYYPGQEFINFDQ